MAINQVNILDEFKDFAGKYNDTIDEIVISGLVNGSNQLELTKFGGGVITIDLPFSNDKIISGMDITITGAGPYSASVSAGTYQINGVPYTYIGGSFPIGITIFPDERIDILYADTSNNVSYLAGTAGPIPIQPNTPLGTLLIGIVYVNSASAGASAIPTAVAAGFVEGQTLRWNNTTNEWVPTGNLNVSTVGNVGVGTFTTSGARLSVNGAVRLESMTAPIPTTDKLYNVGGTLYWNGIAIGTANLVPGTSIGNTLYWDGTQWNETDDFKRLVGSFTESYYNYSTTDSTGVFVNVELGESTSSGARGIEFNVNDTLNTNIADFRLLSQYGSNLATALELIQQDIANDLRSQFLVDPFWMKNEFSLLSDSFNGNFSEDASDHWYKRIGSDVTNTTGNYSDIRQDEGSLITVINSNAFDYYSEAQQDVSGLKVKAGSLSVINGAETSINGNGLQIVNLATGADNIFNLNTGTKNFNIRFNAETQFDVQPNKISLNKRYNVGSKIIGAGNYTINSVLTEFVSHYIIVDDTASNTITLPLASISDNEIIKIVRGSGTNNFNKQIVTSGADTFNATVVTTYNLNNLNHTVTLQGSSLYNTWFIIDASYESDGEKHASYFWDLNATVTPMPVLNTAVKVLGTTSISSGSGFTLTNNRATFVSNFGPTTFSILFTGQGFNSANNRDLTLYIYKNGVVVNSSKIRNRFLSSGVSQSLSINCIETLVNGDFIEVWIANNSGAGENFTMVNGNFIIKEI